MQNSEHSFISRWNLNTSQNIIRNTLRIPKRTGDEYESARSRQKKKNIIENQTEEERSTHNKNEGD